MGGKAKIENLTNTWYGFAVFSAAYALLDRGIGFFSILWGGLGLLVSWFFIYLWGRSLLNRSSLSRFILMIASGILMCMGAVGAATASWAFVHVWELKLVFAAIYSAANAWIMAKSFRTLTDASVKTYIG